MIAGRNRLLWDRADQLLCARCGLGERPYFHHMPPETGSINFCAPAADLVRVGSLPCTRNARSHHFHQKNTYRKLYFFAAQIRACAAVFVEVAVVTLRPFKSFQLFSTVVFRNFFVSFSLFCRVGASSLCARCGLRRYRLRHSATLYLLSQISCDSYTVERPRWFGAWIGNGREKY